jgi:hypothetical protein
VVRSEDLVDIVVPTGEDIVDLVFEIVFTSADADSDVVHKGQIRQVDLRRYGRDLERNF